jgi:hypothetical protein
MKTNHLQKPFPNQCPFELFVLTQSKISNRYIFKAAMPINTGTSPPPKQKLIFIALHKIS